VPTVVYVFSGLPIATGKMALAVGLLRAGKAVNYIVVEDGVKPGAHHVLADAAR